MRVITIRTLPKNSRMRSEDSKKCKLPSKAAPGTKVYALMLCACKDLTIAVELKEPGLLWCKINKDICFFVNV